MSFNKFIQLCSSQDMSFRNTAITHTIKGVYVDTCFAPDVGEWETYIRKEDDDSAVVEMYENEEQAKIGHKKWCKEVRKNPKLEIQEIRDSSDWFWG